MNKHIDQSELGRIIAEKKGLDPKVVSTFIQQLFASIENSLVTNSSVKIEELGSFRIIKSGSSNRILFWGKAAPKDQNESSSKSASLSGEPTINAGEERSEEKVTDKKRNIEIPATPPVRSNTVIEEKRVANPTTEATVASVVSALRRNDESETVVNKPVEKREQATQVTVNTVPAASVNSAETEQPVVEKVVAAQVNKVEADTKPKPITTTETTNYVNRNYTPETVVNRRSVPQPNRYNNSYDTQEEEPQKKNKGLFLPISLAVFGLIVLAVCYNLFFRNDAPPKPEIPESTVVASDAKFVEVHNTDKVNLSRIIVADRNVSIRDIAKKYYGNEQFWPYIYKANINITDKSLTIQTNSFIKIPKLTVDLVNYSTGALDDKVKALGEQIMDELAASETN